MAISTKIKNCKAKAALSKHTQQYSNQLAEQYQPTIFNITKTLGVIAAFSISLRSCYANMAGVQGLLGRAHWLSYLRKRLREWTLEWKQKAPRSGRLNRCRHSGNSFWDECLVDNSAESMETLGLHISPCSKVSTESRSGVSSAFRIKDW